MGLETYNKVWKNLLPQLCLKMYKFNKWIPFTCPNNNNKNSLSRPDMAIFPAIWVWYPCNLFFFLPSFMHFQIFYLIPNFWNRHASHWVGTIVFHGSIFLVHAFPSNRWSSTISSRSSSFAKSGGTLHFTDWPVFLINFLTLALTSWKWEADSLPLCCLFQT